MFEKFGEFDSAEELNKAAMAQFTEGDDDAVRALAAENGLDPEDAEDFIAGDIPALIFPEKSAAMIAALGKLKIEEEALTASWTDEQRKQLIMVDWMDYIRAFCQQDAEFAAAVRKKEKSLLGCQGALLGWAFKHAVPVPADIAKAAGVTVKVTDGTPNSFMAKKLIREYYLGGDPQ